MIEDAALRAIAIRTGCFLRHEALSFGYDDRAIRARVKAGHWVRIQHGAYTTTDVWQDAGDDERHRLAALAVVRTHDSRAVLTHTTGVVMHGIEHWGITLDAVHVTRRDETAGRSTARARYHRGAIPEDQIVLVDGVPVTKPSRAAYEHALLTNVESAVVTFDSVQRLKLATTEDLHAVADEFSNRAGALHARLALQLSQPKSGSVGESRSHYLMWSQGIPQPIFQYEVYDQLGNLVGIADFAWPEYGVLGEFDGLVKYEKLSRPGESPRDVVIREKRREDLMREVTGWKMIRLVWADFNRPQATAERIARVLGIAL